MWFQETPNPDEDINFFAQSLVLIGNLLYEQSQITAAAGQSGWKDMVGCSMTLICELNHLVRWAC